MKPGRIVDNDRTTVFNDSSGELNTSGQISICEYEGIENANNKMLVRTELLFMGGYANHVPLLSGLQYGSMSR